MHSTGFAFCINRSVRRSREDVLVHWEVHWEGVPTSFCKSYLKFQRAIYLMRRTIAFQYPISEPTFVEIRNVETGSMSQVIQGNNGGSLNFAVYSPTRFPRNNRLIRTYRPSRISRMMVAHYFVPCRDRRPIHILTDSSLL